MCVHWSHEVLNWRQWPWILFSTSPSFYRQGNCIKMGHTSIGFLIIPSVKNLIIQPSSVVWIHQRMNHFWITVFLIQLVIYVPNRFAKLLFCESITAMCFMWSCLIKCMKSVLYIMGKLKSQEVVRLLKESGSLLLDQ